MKIPKTNAMRILEQAGIEYETMTYTYDENDLSGLKAADSLGLPPETIFKTIIVHGNRTGYMVGCLSVDKEIEKIAVSAGKRGVQLLLAPSDLIKYLDAKVGDFAG